MNQYLECTPAYGRDYTSAKAVKADWEAGKDFIVQPQGYYVNRRDVANSPFTSLQLRYAKLTKVVVVKGGK